MPRESSEMNNRHIDLGWAQANQNARGLWECLLLSGADVSDFAYETRTEEGREAGFREFAIRGSVQEVVDAVRELRADYDEACAETEEIISGVPRNTDRAGQESHD